MELSDVDLEITDQYCQGMWKEISVENWNYKNKQNGCSRTEKYNNGENSVDWVNSRLDTAE